MSVHFLYDEGYVQCVGLFGKPTASLLRWNDAIGSAAWGFRHECQRFDDPKEADGVFVKIVAPRLTNHTITQTERGVTVQPLDTLSRLRFARICRKQQVAGRMTLPLDDLEALARAATPGPWVIRKVDNYGLWQLGNQPHLPDDLPEEEFEDAWDAWSERDIPICEFGTETKPGEQTNRRNMAFVVATNPQTVLALIARIRELEGKKKHTTCGNVYGFGFPCQYEKGHAGAHGHPDLDGPKGSSPTEERTETDSDISPGSAASHSVDEKQAEDACRRGVTADCGCIDCRDCPAEEER